MQKCCEKVVKKFFFRAQKYFYSLEMFEMYFFSVHESHRECENVLFSHGKVVNMHKKYVKVPYFYA